MTGQHLCGCDSWIRRFLRAFALFFLAALSAPFAFSTGFFGPTVYLSDGGRLVDASPEFYWELELKRLAGNFQTPENLLRPLVSKEEATDSSDDSATAAHLRKDFTTEADEKDFVDALRNNEFKPADPARAMEQHKNARAVIAAMSADALPEEFPSEFSDYHRGAFLFSKGKDHWPEAREVWESLLKRPAAERHYRSVWTAFMLGKLALKSGDPAATSWFQQTRQLTHDGFADSLGLAADSYGWEGRSEWKQQHPEKAARLFLTQLALGDESAVVSLKALIPDREPVEGLLNYGPEAEEREKWDEATRRTEEEKEVQGLKIAAADPLLRRLVTVHILATQADPFFYQETRSRVINRSARWLAEISAAKIAAVEDAEYLGWIAYGAGKYDDAARWLKLSGEKSPAALWLKAKLLRRAGKLDDAIKSMSLAWRTIRSPEAYTGWKKQSGSTEAELENYSDEPMWSFDQSASGDLGGLRLARSEFIDSLDAFVRGKLWSDAAFIAERILTTNELKAYIDRIAPENPSDGGSDNFPKLRYLLGRRLVREDRYSEAKNYLRSPYDKVLEKYRAALNDAVDQGRPKGDRARAWFTAAWIARYDGMELMGTEGAPDGFISEGAFEEPDLAQERLSGIYTKTDYTLNGQQKTTKRRIPLKATPAELARLSKNKIAPNVRFHYRVIAGALAFKAAQILPDNSEELADVLNRAGGWVQDRDKKLADAYYESLIRRCPSTKLGRDAREKRWFVDASGPWSEEQRTSHEKMEKELNFGDSVRQQ